MKNVFDANDVTEIINRINSLDATAPHLWGKMDVAQMLAHCNVIYEYIYDNIHSKPKGFKKFMLKFLVKPIVVGDKPYNKNSRTAPDFIKTSEYDFKEEKNRLTEYIKKTQELGGDYFHNKESHSFGVLTEKEWNNMFFKHLDHHLKQFGA